jgi:hypothetical protein
LQLTFSESIRPPTAGTTFPARSPAGAYVFVLGAGALLPASAGANAWLFPVVSVTDASARPAVAAAGDSVWIDPLAGLSDSVGNVQSNPANVRVPLRIRTLLTWNIRPPDSTGVARLPSRAQGAQWSVYAGPSASPRFGTAPYDLPTVHLDPADRPHAGVLDFEATHPFFVELAVYDNLGQFVSRVRLDAGPGEFEKLPSGSVPGTRGTFLVWNGATDSRGHAGTGAYVFVWRVVFRPDDGPPQTAQGKRIIGILRER